MLKKIALAVFGLLILARFFFVTGGRAPANAPINPSSIYVETELTEEETCKPFSGTPPPGMAHPPPPPAASDGAAMQYIWDMDNKTLLDEKTRYGYQPEYHPNRVSFATNGRPMIRDNQFHLQVLTDAGSWKSIDLLAAAKESLRRQENDNWPLAPAGQYALTRAEYADGNFGTESRVVFDTDCNAYALINANRSLGFSLLLHSKDGGHSWGAYKIPESEGAVTGVSMEVPTHKHVLGQPPAVMVHQLYMYPNSPNSIKLVTPSKRADGTLDIGPATLAVTHTIRGGSVGGGENMAVSSGDLIHIVYPGEKVERDPFTGRRGTPSYAVTFSRSQRKVIAGPVFLAVGVNQTDLAEVDEHNQPVIAIDGKNYLHVAIAGHHSPLYYRRSTQPNSIAEWTPTFPIGRREGYVGETGDQYTYPSLVIDSKDQPVVTARSSKDGDFFKLVTMTRHAATGWGNQQVILDPGRAFYAHWYHKISIDPWGRLFLSYGYYPDELFSDEAEIFGNTYGFKLTHTDSCVATIRGRRSKGFRNCVFTGYDTVNLSVMVRPSADEPYRLATTPDFFLWK